MNSLNKVQLIGNVTADPEVKVVGEDRTVAKFSIATNRTWKDSQGEKQDVADYHNIVVWGKLAEIIAKYVTKGKKLYVEGRLQSSSWEDEQGVKKYRTEIVADSMIMLSGGEKKGFDEHYQEGPEDMVIPKEKKRISIEDVPF